MQTIDETHRARLLILAKELGSQRKLADKLERSPSQVNQWIHGAKDSKTGKPRTLEKATARYIEKKTGKPEGWMDQPVNSGMRYVVKDRSVQVASEPAQAYGGDWPFAADMLREVLSLSASEKLMAEGALRLFLAELRAQKAAKESAA